jgi:hypothetical protein
LLQIQCGFVTSVTRNLSERTAQKVTKSDLVRLIKIRRNKTVVQFTYLSFNR